MERWQDERFYMQDAPCITILSERTSKARKEYKCCYCGLKIEKGSKYFRVTYLDDDSKLQCDRAHTSTARCAWE